MGRFAGVKLGIKGAGADRDPAAVAAGVENVVTGRKVQLNATPIMADGSKAPGHLTPEQRLELFGTDDESDELCQPCAIVHPVVKQGGAWVRTGEALPYEPGTGAEAYLNIGSRHDDNGCTPTLKSFKACDVEAWVVLRDVPAPIREQATEEHESNHIVVQYRGEFRKGRSHEG